MDAEIEAADFHGKPADCKMKLAFGESGDLEIELIQLTEGDSPHKSFIDGGGNGMHHIRFKVDDVDQKIIEANKLGYQSIWYKRLSDEVAFVYLERQSDPLIIEFLQMP